jgi:cell division ATPase FtsA
MGYMSKGGMAKKGVMSYNMGGMVKSQVNNLKKAKR